MTSFDSDTLLNVEIVPVYIVPFQRNLHIDNKRVIYYQHAVMCLCYYCNFVPY
jgi:hypothetical protein